VAPNKRASGQKMLTAYLPLEDHDALLRYAALIDRSASQLVREWVRVSILPKLKRLERKSKGAQ
jgi:hypothetical protein